MRCPYPRGPVRPGGDRATPQSKDMKNDSQSDFNRREFLRDSSLASLMVLMGGIPIHAAEEAPKAAADAPTTYKGEAIPVNVGVIGCGVWAREILKTLALLPNGPVVAICDKYEPYLKRASSLAPKAEKYAEYQQLLANKDVQAVIVATPTHLHKEIVLAALKAGKHVYCEAPLAATVEEAREIAKAAKASFKLNFQPGLQSRADKQVYNLGMFVRNGVLGKTVKARSQFHKKQSWRQTSPNPDREIEMNWRLNKAVSLGLAGEIGIHQMDIASWFLMGQPVSVSGFGTIVKWKDGRDVADSIQAVLEYPEGVLLSYEATLANSFDAEINMFYGTDCAIMQRERRAWMFKEVDAPLLGWEVYAMKENFYKESGIILAAGATKQTSRMDNSKDKPVDEKSALQYGLEAFLIRSAAYSSAVADYADTGADTGDTDDFRKYMSELSQKLDKQLAESKTGAPTVQDGYEATIVAIKTNEAIVKGQKIAFSKEWFAIS